jgi:hypothetical protein
VAKNKPTQPNSEEPGTMAIIQEHIQNVELAARAHEILHLSTVFVGAPDASGIMTCFVTGPDALVNDMKGLVDETVKAVLKRHGFGKVNPAMH